MRILGKEIWGNLITKYPSSYVLKRKVNDFRKICNYVIMEHERRVLFDFRRQYSSMHRKKATDRRYHDKFRKLRRTRRVNYLRRVLNITDIRGKQKILRFSKRRKIQRLYKLWQVGNGMYSRFRDF